MNPSSSRGMAVLAASVLTVALAGTAYAASATDVQANDPQVAGDPTSNATAVFPTNKQNEPTVAVNPAFPGVLLAGANDEQQQPACGPGLVRGPAAPANDCSFFPGVGTSGVYRSTDGGATWQNLGLLDDQNGWTAGAFVSDGDPVIAWGPKPDGNGGFTWDNGARAYYASLASYKPGRSPFPPNKAPEYIAVSFSDDNGSTWEGPFLATTRDNPVDFNDKEWIAVDTNESSPYFGRVYASWTSFRQNTSEPVETSYSTDGGRTWSAPKQVSPAANTLKKGRQGSMPAVGPDGTVYVAFEQGPAQVVVISKDGGKSWTRPIKAAPVADIQDPIPGANFRTNSFPSIAAGTSGVHIVWADLTAAGGRVKIVSSSDGGRTWSAPKEISGAEGYAFFPGVAVAPNGRVDVGYQVLHGVVDADSFGTGNARVTAYYTSSTDDFTARTPVSEASDPAVSAQNNLQRQFWGDYNVMTSTDASAWFIYTDSRNGVGCAAVDEYQQYLVDNGLVRHGDMYDRVQRRIGAQPYSPGDKPAPGFDCPAVQDKRFGNTDVFVSVITP